MSIRFADLVLPDRPARIEYQWISPHRRERPVLVFLHEGLGSLAMWKDFPERLCEVLSCRGLVYSRPGYGRSTPRAANESWRPDFMHVQAIEVLPALLRYLEIDAKRERLWLFGHSDGASISLLHAARSGTAVAGAIVLAPHILVEDISLSSIAQARQAYLSGDLRERLARYHDDPDSAFWGWNDIWLHADFRRWSIEAEISAIACPVLAVQGLDDQYGTLEQIRGIARRLPHAELLELPGCGHSPHRDQPDALIRSVVDFVSRHA